MKAECAVDTCQAPTIARGWCRLHYSRWRNHGDPLAAVGPSHRTETIESRFWRRVDKTDTCWLWNGSRRKKDYGVFNYPGGGMAYRYSYELHNGPIPDGMTIDHICFNPPCVNPAHLQLLTREQNARRQQSKDWTHCKRGHEYTPENTVPTVNIRPDGSPCFTRRCRICYRATRRAYRADQRRRRGLEPQSDLPKSHCPHGHVYAEPNLVVSASIKGRRQCLACARARASLQKKPGVFQERAAEKYEAIMREVE